MASSIGAGARIYMGDASAPMSTTNGGTSSDADLDDVTGSLKSFVVSMTQGDVDITKLNADSDSYFRKHIAGLRDATATSDYGDDTAGTFIRRLDAICSGTVHTKGRGMVDIRVRPYGVATGKLQIDFTAFLTTSPLNTELETEIGGSLSWQINGKPTLSVQS